MSKYGHRTGNWLEAIVNKLGGEHEADRFLRGEIAVCVPEHCWREEEGFIYFTVISDGTTGEGWISRLSNKNVALSSYAQAVLRSPDFNPTSGVIYEIAVLKGKLFTDSGRVTKKIRTNAEFHALSTPGAEIACLIRNKLTGEDIKAMGLTSIVTMHEPIADQEGRPILLSAFVNAKGNCLHASWDRPDEAWLNEDGFAFVDTQIVLSE